MCIRDSYLFDVNSYNNNKYANSMGASIINRYSADYRSGINDWSYQIDFDYNRQNWIRQNLLQSPERRKITQKANLYEKIIRQTRKDSNSSGFSFSHIISKASEDSTLRRLSLFHKFRLK